MVNHETVSWESFDGGLSYEPVCRCGFHSAHDIVFLEHCRNNNLKDYNDKLRNGGQP